MKNVYFIKWDENEKFVELFQKAGLNKVIEKNDLVAIKTHMGEEGGTGFIKPVWIKKVVDEVKKLNGKPFITDTNTIYAGDRSNAIGHHMVAHKHGFTIDNVGAPVIIADGPKGLSSFEIKVPGKILKKVKIAAGIYEANSMVVTSHFKGHLAAGFGGAIKNLSMGCATRLGKFEMHSGVMPNWKEENCIACGLCVKSCSHGAIVLDEKVITIFKDKCAGCGECVGACRYNALTLNWGKNTEAFQEKMAEYSYGATRGKRAIYINFLNHITLNCDCMGLDEKPLLDDIGILASLDPVAIDQACLDMIKEKAGDVFKKERPHIDGEIQLKHAEKLGVGNRKYNLINL